MKFQFEANLKHQDDAINSVIDIFKGAFLSTNPFTSPNLGIETSANYIEKSEVNLNIIKNNLKQIQIRNNIPYNDFLNLKFNNLKFDIEMETGTGKTYVFIKTILELNQKYGLKKFVIIVPSIAIKEGIRKSFQITEEHFKTFYGKAKYYYKFYNSTNDINEFVNSSNIQILIINIHAFNSISRKLNTIAEEIGCTPIELLAETHPVVIIDEPQSTEGKKDSNNYKNIENLNAIFTLKYSATFREKTNLVYCLNAIEAYQQNLVKKIAISSSKIINNGNYFLLELKEIKAEKNEIKARIKINKKNKNIYSEELIWIKRNDDLYVLSNENKNYKNYIVESISNYENEKNIIFTNGVKVDFSNTISEFEKRNLIKQTIITHLDLQLNLLDVNIKVLSLFFIDKVENYRVYDENNFSQNGIIANIFEEEFSKIILENKKYQKLISKLYLNEDINILKTKVHDGYFSKDKKTKKFSDNSESDESTYNKIMQNKEKLLSFKEKLSFIFSHSALKEGWDNPNVFQICTLNSTKSEMKKHQEIGRGLRLCVDQNGNRNTNKDLNILTVFINDSYEEFVKNYQNELEKSLKIQFGILPPNCFNNIKINNEYLGEKGSLDLVKILIDLNYLDKERKILNTFINDEKNHKVDFQNSLYNENKDEIIQIIKTYSFENNKPINANDLKDSELDNNLFNSEKFSNLFEKINYKTQFKISLSPKVFYNKCLDNLVEYNFDNEIKKPFFQNTKTKIDLKNSGIEKTSFSINNSFIEKKPNKYINFIEKIKENTNITSKTIASLFNILKKDYNHNEFLNRNIEKYIEIFSNVINKTIKEIDHKNIYYEVLKDLKYSKKIFLAKKININIENLFENITNSKKLLYKYIKLDSNIEIEYLKEAIKDEKLDLILKLPSEFKINTFEGEYNPDFVLYYKSNLYFIIETKGSENQTHLRQIEDFKIESLKKHIEAINNDNKWDTNNKKLNFALKNKYDCLDND